MSQATVNFPEPDIAVVPGKRSDYRKQHPKTAALVVEVSDTTLASDRTRKGSLYARANLQDYWIVNLVDRQLEVYRRPQVDGTQAYGYGYGEKLILSLKDTVSPLAKPDLVFEVCELFPQ